MWQRNIIRVWDRKGSVQGSSMWPEKNIPPHLTLYYHRYLTCLFPFSFAPLSSYTSMPRLSFQNTHLITLLSILTLGNSVYRMKCKLFDLTDKVLKLRLPTFIILSPNPPLCVLNKHFCQNGCLSIEDTFLIFISVFAYAIPLTWKKKTFIPWLANSNVNHSAKPPWN